MKLELQSASNFLVHLIRLGRKKNIHERQLEEFGAALTEALRRRYRDHWFPEKPFKGSGYRCIRINGKMDPVIAQAGEKCGLAPHLIHSIFPSELTMWIDPLEVSYRIGENGSICVLYEFSEGCTNEPWRPSHHSNSTTSSSAADSSNKENTTNGSGSVSHSSPKTAPSSTPATAQHCKDSMRKVDFMLDPRNSLSIDQLAAYVSSS